MRVSTKCSLKSKNRIKKKKVINAFELFMRPDPRSTLSDVHKNKFRWSWLKYVNTKCLTNLIEPEGDGKK